LTELMAAERGYEVDRTGFETALEEQRARSREARATDGAGGGDMASVEIRRRDAQQEFVGYEELRVETPVLGYEAEGDRVRLVLQRNPFYRESGGQVADRGTVRGEGWKGDIERVLENDTGDVVVEVRVETGSPPDVVDSVLAEVAEHVRRDTERNHTATHLLHAALRHTLGDHVQQAGSLVAPDRLRFDFSHTGPLSREQRLEIERHVNEAIWANAPVEIGHRPYREALEAGAMALFGEKYGDVVRVVSVPGMSLELCGGCHVRTTGQIGQLRIVTETGVAAGIRRIEAVTGRRAWRLAVDQEAELEALAAKLGVSRRDLSHRVSALQDEVRRLEALLAAWRGAESADEAERLVAEAEELPGGGGLVRTSIRVAAGTDLGEFGDLLRARLQSGAAIVHVAQDDGKTAFLGVVTDDWIARGLKAGDLVRTASRTTGSGGGGRPHLAQGGVGDASRVEAALDEAADQARELALTVASGA